MMITNEFTIEDTLRFNFSAVLLRKKQDMAYILFLFA